jgi:hypothetical protein
MKFYSFLLVFLILLFIGCEKENIADADVFSLAQFEIIKNWEIVSVEGAPSNLRDTCSIWTFNADGTYTWFFDLPGYYNDFGAGTYHLENNRLHLNGVVPGKFDSIIQLTLAKSNTKFSFLDINNDRWLYQLAETEPEYSKSISFFEQSPYSEDCLSRPNGTVCLGFIDGYVWLISTSVGGCENDIDYYSEGREVHVACGGHFYPYNTIEYHHILNTNLIKKVPRY